MKLLWYKILDYIIEPLIDYYLTLWPRYNELYGKTISPIRKYLKVYERRHLPWYYLFYPLRWFIIEWRINYLPIYPDYLSQRRELAYLEFARALAEAFDRMVGFLRSPFKMLLALIITIILIPLHTLHLICYWLTTLLYLYRLYIYNYDPLATGARFIPWKWIERFAPGETSPLRWIWAFIIIYVFQLSNAKAFDLVYRIGSRISSLGRNRGPLPWGALLTLPPVLYIFILVRDLVGAPITVLYKARYWTRSESLGAEFAAYKRGGWVGVKYSFIFFISNTVLLNDLFMEISRICGLRIYEKGGSKWNFGRYEHIGDDDE